MIITAGVSPAAMGDLLGAGECLLLRSYLQGPVLRRVECFCPACLPSGLVGHKYPQNTENKGKPQQTAVTPSTTSIKDTESPAVGSGTARRDVISCLGGCCWNSLFCCGGSERCGIEVLGVCGCGLSAAFSLPRTRYLLVVENNSVNKTVDNLSCSGLG